MKKLSNYSLLLLLFSILAFACSKEDSEVNPTSLLKSSSTNEVAIAGYGLSCLTQNGSQWSFEIAAGARHGLSNIQLELLECPETGTTVVLGDEVTITAANVVINGLTYPLTPIYNSDGSCDKAEGTFSSFVKFEFGTAVFNGITYKIDDLLKKYGGTLTFILSDHTIVLYGTNVIIKTGGKDNKCYSGSIENCNGCTEIPPVEDCSFSQGYYFNAGRGGAEWSYVTVGTATINKGDYTLPGTSPQMRAFFQAATLILSETDRDALSPDVLEALEYIEAYFFTYDLSHTPTNPVSKRLQEAAGKIGNWIDDNHC